MCQTVTDRPTPVCVGLVRRRRSEGSLPVHIAVDTGMHRLGTTGAGSGGGRDAACLLSWRCGAGSISGSGGQPLRRRIAGLYPHAADVFEALARKLRGVYAVAGLHAQASRGILNQPQPDRGYARSGSRFTASSTAGQMPCAAAPGAGSRWRWRARVVSRRVACHPAEGAGYVFLAFRLTASDPAGRRPSATRIGHARESGEKGAYHVLPH